MWYIQFKDADNNEVRENFISMESMFTKLNEIKEGLGNYAIVSYGKVPTKKQLARTKRDLASF
jgi:hypothetical protein